MEKATFHKQLKTVYNSFLESPKTMLQVAIETGILRANICRYVRTFRKLDKIAIVRIGYCPITKHKAGFYTTDPALFPSDNQLKIRFEV